MALRERLAEWLLPGRVIPKGGGTWFPNPGPDAATAVDVEIYENIDPAINPQGVIKPSGFRINGTDVLTPDGRPVTVAGLVDKRAACTITCTLFVRSLTVHGRSTDAAA